MIPKDISLLLVSDFNIEPLAGYLNNDETLCSIESTTAPFGSTLSLLADDSHEIWKNSYECAVIWTLPEIVIPCFGSLIHNETVSSNDIFNQIDLFSDLLIRLKKQIKTVLVPSWVIPTNQRGYGMLDWNDKIGLTNMLMKMNLHLAQRISDAQGIYMLNTSKWIATCGKTAFNPKLWYMAKIPYSQEVFKYAMGDIKAALLGVSGGAKKCIIVDLDDTLWGGVAAETGWESIRLGGHDYWGEAYLDFQKGLKALSRRGIVLAIASKNDTATALEVFEKHPEMILKIEDFAGWKINWNDKAQNIVDLTKELNLGLDSVVFIDNHPLERARVKESLPEVTVPDWPTDPLCYPQALSNLTCFDSPYISKEDSTRTQSYHQEKKRQTIKQSFRSLDDWLATLDITVTVEELNTTNIERAVQLLNKTNQMNLSTRRLTAQEFLSWTETDNRKVFTYRVSDKFGDSGLTGLTSIECNDGKGQIIDFVLSCRVFGRKIEEAMLFTLIEYAKSKSLRELHGEYLCTHKNKPCLTFLRQSGFHQQGNHFKWIIETPFNQPKSVQVDYKTNQPYAKV